MRRERECSIRISVQLRTISGAISFCFQNLTRNFVNELQLAVKKPQSPQSYPVQLQKKTDSGGHNNGMFEVLKMA